MAMEIEIVKPEIDIVVTYPHVLKPAQITELSSVVDTIEKYENTLKYLCIVALHLDDLCTDNDRVNNADIYKAFQTILKVHNALQPRCEDGCYSRHFGLRGPWNPKTKSYDRYK